MAAAFVADLYTNPVTSTTNSTTIAGATNTAVSAGNTVFLGAIARGATAGTATISGLPGDAVTESLNSNRAGSPACNLWRIYLPSGMSTSTTITVTWDTSCSRKVMDAVVWSGVGNANAQASQTANAADSSPTTGTSGATTTTTGVHVVLWCWQSTLSTNSGASPTDTEGAMNERTDQLVGASTFAYMYMADKTVTAAHAGGETGTVTVTNTLASWAGVQAIWDGATAVVAPQRNRRYTGRASRIRPPVGPRVGWR